MVGKDDNIRTAVSVLQLYLDGMHRGRRYGIFFLFFLSTHIYFPAFGRAVVKGVVLSPLRLLSSTCIERRVQ